MSGHWPHDHSTDLEPEALSTKLPARPKNEIYYELKSIGEMQALSPRRLIGKRNDCCCYCSIIGQSASESTYIYITTASILKDQSGQNVVVGYGRMTTGWNVCIIDKVAR